MSRAGIPILFLVSMFFVALPTPLPIMPPRRELPPPHLRPLCASQLTLVNFACGTILLVPSPFQSSDATDEGNGRRNGTRSSRRGDGNGTGREGDRHRHKHKHRDKPKGISPEQGYCCRWLKMVETVCVCDILTHLPLFLSWPLHRYIVSVGEACSVTFSCGGRLRSP
ncbi:hypothetical protein F3Y22_tig00116951pilonHSYRG00560 [Hibiscus syriacus]|uniref:Secreted protein n=1 Tax=Hibiscus syriacus TaxID=106335 RepID=A0A6A2WL75_HIBSY|nr:uncharacterized protein LOC120189010 [Hibiscus syriacus]KAE8660642.1 hypothetical protein F3Y22_tig00116951pilonHSYRG00560 [Hibiscus syriacus]